MRLTLQLSCYNGGRYLPYVFEALKKQTLQDWHLFILDNASDPENKKLIDDAVDASSLPISLFRVERNIGFAGAHNFLYEKSKDSCDAVQLLNDDAILEPDFLERCLHALETQPSCGAVSGRVLRWDFDARNEPSKGKTTTIDSFGLKIDWCGFVHDIGQHANLLSIPAKRDADEVFGISGCLPMYRVSAVNAVSFDGALFDTQYVIYKEDCELAYRLHEAGYHAFTVNSASAYHRRTYGQKTTDIARPVNQNSYQSYRNHLWLLLVHIRGLQLITSRIGVLPAECAKAIYWLIRKPHFVMQAFQETWQERSRLLQKRRHAHKLRCQRDHVLDDGQPDKPTADIAIIIVGHNDLSEECLTTLEAARKRSQHSTALVVVDNQSVNFKANEFVAKYAPDAWTLLRNGDFGYGRSMNRGAEQVTAKYYFILNPDTKLVDPELFNTLYNYMESRPDVGLAGPRILNFAGELQDTCRRFPSWFQPLIQRTSLKKTAFGQAYLHRFLMKDYDHVNERNVDWFQGSAMFMRGDLWKQLGGFDHRYWLYFEDIDLCRKTWTADKRVVYLPNVVLQHAHGRQSAQIQNFFLNFIKVKETRAHIYSWLKYMWKWLGQPLPSTEYVPSSPTSMPPKVAIIYLTYNGKESYTDITRCFKSIQNLDYPRDRFEVICVENPSAHGASWPFIEKEWMPLVGTSFPQITIHKNEKDLGYSGANNVGLQIAIEHGCDYVFLLNQDADVDSHFLTAAVERAERDARVMFVQSLVLLGQEKNLVNSVGNRYHFLGYGYAGGYRWTTDQAKSFFEQEKRSNPDLEVPTFSGAAVLVRVAMAKQIGLFDAPFYMYHEDIDATFNARIHGWKSVVEPTSIVYHYYEFSKSIKKFYWMERNRFMVNLTYYKLPTLILIAPAFFGVELISLLFAAKSGWLKEKLRSWGFYWKLSTWQWVWARRQRIQRERTISDRKFLKICESKILFQEATAGSANDHTITRDVNGSIVQRVANPLMTLYWKVIYSLICW